MPPPRRQGRRVTAGAILLAALTAVAVLVFFLDELLAARAPTYTLVAVFPEAPRLARGAEVWVAGSVTGRVTGIDLVPPAEREARVAATLRLPRAVQPLIRADSEVRIARRRPIADPAVDILPGSAAAPVLRHGDTLRARPTITVEAAMQRSRAFRAAFDSLLHAAATLNEAAARRRPATDSLERQAAAVNDRLARLAVLLRQSELDEFLRDPAWRTDLRRIRSTMTDIAGALAARAREPGIDPQPLRVRIESVARHLALLERRIARLEAVLAEPRGLLPRLGRDTAIARTIHEVQAQIDSLIRETRRNPLRYFF